MVSYFYDSLIVVVTKRNVLLTSSSNAKEKEKLFLGGWYRTPGTIPYLNYAPVCQVIYSACNVKFCFTLVVYAVYTCVSLLACE